MAPVVALHDQLVGTCDQRQAVIVIESLRNVLAKGVPSTSGADSPAAPVVGVAPKQVAHGTFVRHLLYSVERANVVECIDRRRQASVQAEDLVVDEGGEREVVEEIGKVFPDVRVAVFAQALVVEAVDLRNLTRLVVSAKDCDALRIADLQGNEEGDRLYGEVAAIDVIACALMSAGRIERVEVVTNP